MYCSLDTSCAMRSIGKIGARSSGPTGCPVPGCNGGGGGVGRSWRMLYQRVGISSSSSRTLWRSGADTAYLFLGGERPGGGAAVILGLGTRGHKGVPTGRNTCQGAVVD